jgi:hypothetical protein
MFPEWSVHQPVRRETALWRSLSETMLCRWIDTSLASPNDIVPWRDAPAYAIVCIARQRVRIVVLWAPLAAGAPDAASASA